MSDAKMINEFLALYQSKTPEPTLSFGKHSGFTYSFVYENDKKYCAWCLGQDPKYFKRFQDYIRQRITEDNSSKTDA